MVEHCGSSRSQVHVSSEAGNPAALNMIVHMPDGQRT
jgi:hypothetical protein